MHVGVMVELKLKLPSSGTTRWRHTGKSMCSSPHS